MILYKHPNNTDVAFDIIKRYYIEEKDMWSIKVSWWNIKDWYFGINTKKAYPMQVTQRLKISENKLKEFERITV